MVLKVGYRYNYHLYFPLYVRCPLTILKFKPDTLKLVFFFFIFWYILKIHKSVLLLAIFLKFNFSQTEKRGFIWPKTSDFLFQKYLIFYSEKRMFPENNCSWIFYCSEVNIFIAYHLSKNYLQSFEDLFRKKICCLKITVPEFQKYEKK